MSGKLNIKVERFKLRIDRVNIKVNIFIIKLKTKFIKHSMSL